MWVMTVAGAFSAVAKTPGSDTLVVRTRCEEDLRNLQDWVQSMSLPRPPAIFPQRHTDYPWRVEIDKQTWAEFLVSQTDDIEYTNFKSKIATVNAHHEHVYHNVWAALLKIEDEDDPKKMEQWRRKEAARKTAVTVTWSSPSIGTAYRQGGSLFGALELDTEPDVDDEVRKIHSMTDEEFRELMEEEPRFYADPIDEAPVPLPPRQPRRGAEPKRRSSKKKRSRY